MVKRLGKKMTCKNCKYAGVEYTEDNHKPVYACLLSYDRTSPSRTCKYHEEKDNG